MKHLSFLIFLALLLPSAAVDPAGLTPLTTPASGDILIIHDVSDSTQSAGGSTKGITWANLFKSPTLVTPALGVATATSVNGLTLTTSTGILTIADGKTLTASATLTLTGSDGSTLNIGTGGTLGTAAFTAATAYQPASANLTTFAAIAPAANVVSLLSAADYAAIKSLLSLANVENTALSTWAGTTNLTTLGTIGTGTWQGSVIAPAYLGTGSSITTKYLRGDGTWQTLAGTGDLLSTNNLSDLANAATARTNLGLAIGTHVQSFDLDLTTWAGVTPGTGVATWLATPTIANLETVLASANVILATEIDTIAELNAVIADADLQPLDADLTDLADGTLSGSKVGSGIAAANISGLPDVWIVAISDETTDITTGTAKATFRAPYAATVTAVRANVNTVSSSGTPTIDINEAGTTILSTKLTIDASEKTSVSAVVAAVISDTSLADDAEITIDIDTAGTGAKGAKVHIYVTRQ